MSTNSPASIQLVHPPKSAPARDRFLRLPEVENITGLKKTTVYGLIKEGKFPRQIRVTRRVSVWSEAAILSWVQSQMQ